MSKFVDIDMSHKIGQPDISTRHPLIQNSASKQPDNVRLSRLVGDRFLSERDAFIKPGQAKGVIHLEVGQHGVARKIFDPKRDSSGGTAELFRKRCDGFLSHGLDVGEAGGGGICVHVHDMDKTRPV